MWGPSYLGLTWSKSKSWLQDISSNDIDYVVEEGPCLTWERISTTCVISMWGNDKKCKYMSICHLKNLARKGLSSYESSPPDHHSILLCLPGLCWQTMCLAAWLQGCPPGHCLSTPSEGHPRWAGPGRSMPEWLIHWRCTGPNWHLQGQHWITTVPRDDLGLERQNFRCFDKL